MKISGIINKALEVLMKVLTAVFYGGMGVLLVALSVVEMQCGRPLATLSCLLLYATLLKAGRDTVQFMQYL